MDSNRTIVFFTGTLDAGGLERFITRVSIEAKRNKMFTPVVVCLRKQTGIFLAELQKEGIEVREAPAGWERSVSSLFRLGKMIRQLKPHAVHSQVNFSLFQQLLAVRFFTQAKFLITERNCYPLTGFSLFRRILQFYLLKLWGTHYSGNSVDVVKHLAAQVRYPVQRIPVIPNGMEIPSFDTSLRTRIREQHQWREDDFVIGYIARFAAHKGQDYFANVFMKLHHQFGDRIKVCFIGDGPQRRTIEDKLQQSSFRQSVIFTGIIANVNDYYQAFDCVALLSEYEGMPNVVLEAMGNALPVVANAVGNVEELMAGGEGIINRSSDPEITAALFGNLIMQPETRKRIGLKAQEKIKKDFSLASTLQLLQYHYEN